MLIRTVARKYYHSYIYQEWQRAIHARFDFCDSKISHIKNNFTYISIRNAHSHSAHTSDDLQRNRAER